MSYCLRVVTGQKNSTYRQWGRGGEVKGRLKKNRPTTWCQELEASMSKRQLVLLVPWAKVWNPLGWSTNRWMACLCISHHKDGVLLTVSMDESKRCCVQWNPTKAERQILHVVTSVRTLEGLISQQWAVQFPKGDLEGVVETGQRAQMISYSIER